ncbi:MAG: hypothetical protein HGA86_07975, partial [Anaerolineaceae bacterium]|nr:hypothetical protein [Anaerolineaceae bacterium]
MPKWLKRTLYIVLILAVTITAFGLRFRAATLLSIDYDEDDYLSAGQHYASALRAGDLAELSRYSFNYEHPPLAKLAYGLVLSFLPEGKQVNPPPISSPPASTLPQPQFKAARFTAVALGTLEVLALAVINPIAGLFLGIHTFTIKYTSQVMLESLPALLSLLAVIAYTKSKKRWDLWLVLSSALLGMTAASKYLYVVAGIAIALHWLTEIIRTETGFKWKDLLPLLAWGVFALVFFNIFDPFLWPDPIGRLIQSLQYNITYSQSSAVTSAGFPFYQPFVWLTENVPWHPGVFLIGLDVLIAL